VTLLARSISEFAAHKLRSSEGPVLVSTNVESLAEVTLIPPILDDPHGLPPMYANNISVNLGESWSLNGRMNLT